MSRVFVDQYGRAEFARTVRELRAKSGGRLPKMYVDKKDGRTMHVGYVCGNRWFSEFQPLERPA